MLRLASPSRDVSTRGSTQPAVLVPLRVAGESAPGAAGFSRSRRASPAGFTATWPSPEQAASARLTAPVPASPITCRRESLRAI